jgi:hypothetical protein
LPGGSRGLGDVYKRQDVLTVGGIPETVNQVIPMPDAAVMKQIIEAL